MQTNSELSFIGPHVLINMPPIIDEHKPTETNDSQNNQHNLYQPILYNYICNLWVKLIKLLYVLIISGYLCTFTSFELQEDFYKTVYNNYYFYYINQNIYFLVNVKFYINSSECKSVILIT